MLNCKICKTLLVGQQERLLKTCSRACSLENRRLNQIKATRSYLKREKLKQCLICRGWFKRRKGGSSYCLEHYKEGRKRNRKIVNKKAYLKRKSTKKQ